MGDPKQMEWHERKKKPKKQKKIKWKELRRKNPQFRDRYNFEKEPLPNVPVVIFPLLHKKNQDMKSRIVLASNEVARYLMEVGLESFVDLRSKKLPGQKY